MEISDAELSETCQLCAAPAVGFFDDRGVTFEVRRYLCSDHALSLERQGARIVRFAEVPG